MLLTLKKHVYELSTTLRVVYALRDIAHANSLQEAMGAISSLDLEGQLELLYAAYKAGEGSKENAVDKNTFIDEVLDSFGIFAITGVINKLTDGLLYSGLTPEEIESKKKEVEKAATETATGATFSAVDIN